MEYTNFGKNGPKISRLGFGCMRLPMLGEGKDAKVNDELAGPLLKRAYDLGVNYFDTAWGYLNRDGQRAVGKAIKPFRENVMLSTKLPIWEIKSQDDFWRYLDAALNELDTSYIDYYHIHALNKERWEIVKRFDVLKLMEQAKAKGLVKALAFSYHDTPDLLWEMGSTGVFDSLLCQYNLIDRTNEEYMQKLSDRGMGVVVMGPVGGGALAEGGKALCDKFGCDAKNSIEMAFRFVFGNPAVSCSLSGMGSIEMLEQNIGYVENAVKNSSPEEWARLKLANEEIQKLQGLYCTGCDYCDLCPKGIRPSRHFKTYNGWKVWGTEEAARAKYAQMGSEAMGTDAGECVGCGLCAAKCPQKIDIPKELKRVKADFERC